MADEDPGKAVDMAGSSAAQSGKPMRNWDLGAGFQMVRRNRAFFLLPVVCVMLAAYFVFARNGTGAGRAAIPVAPNQPQRPGAVSENPAYRRLRETVEHGEASRAASAGADYIEPPESLPTAHRISVSPLARSTPSPRIKLPISLPAASYVRFTPLPQPRQQTSGAISAYELARMRVVARAMGEQLHALERELAISGQETVALEVPAAGAADTSRPGRGYGAGLATAGACKPPPPAGEVDYGVLNTAIDSDIHGPVLVTVAEGSTKGAKLIGSFSRESDKGVLVTFDRMSIGPITCKIAAVAVNPDTSLTALESDVNHHYLTRFGTLIASSLAQGYGQAVAMANTNYVVTSNGGLAAYTNIPLSQALPMALGQVGMELGQNMQDFFRLEPSVRVNAGSAIAVMFVTPADMREPVEPQRAQQLSQAAPGTVNPLAPNTGILRPPVSMSWGPYAYPVPYGYGNGVGAPAELGPGANEPSSQP